ncbi:putative signal peptide-containing secreted protein [Cryptosporidium parvum]
MCTKQSLLVFFIILNVFLQLSENGDRLSLLYGFSIIGLRSAGGCGFRKLFCLGSGDYGEGRLHPTLGPTVDGLRISSPIISKTQSTTAPPSPFPPPSPPPSPLPPPLPPKVRVKKGPSGGSQSQTPSFPLSLPCDETIPGSNLGKCTGNGSKEPSSTDGHLGGRPGSTVSPPPLRVPSLYDNVSDGNVEDSEDGAPKKPPLPANWRLPLNNENHNRASHHHHHHHHQHQHQHQHHHHHHHHHQDDCGDGSRPPQKPHLPVGFRLRK